MKVLIIGSGNMGKTYARSFLASRFIAAENLYILDKNSSQAMSIPEITATNVFTVAGQFVKEADIIILAVKPQDFQELSESIRGLVDGKQLVISIMAGIRLTSIAQMLGIEKIVRCMPNLPAQIGMSMTVFTSSPAIDKKELFIVQNLINTTGKSVYVEEEGMIDAATAISGSGPAYVYYFMDAMIKAGVKMGFTPSQAELLVNQTFMGAVHLHNQSEFTCEEWITKVASKGGTTEAALKVLKANHVDENIIEALQAALARAKELGK